MRRPSLSRKKAQKAQNPIGDANRYPVTDGGRAGCLHFMRIMVRALLPLGEGMIPDPFMGSGSTIAAAEAVGYTSTGLELDAQYSHLAQRAIPRLAALYLHLTSTREPPQN